MNTKMIIGLCASGAGFIAGLLYGKVDGILICLLAMTSIDYITGILKGIYDKKLSSEIGFKGICRKILIYIIVAVGHLLDVHIVGSGDSFRAAFIFYYVANEGISIIENCAHMGLPVPEKLRNILDQVKNEN